MGHEWEVSLEEFWVAALDESGGDEPVMGMIGFHSTWGVEGSTKVWRLPVEGDLWPKGVALHSTHRISPRVGTLRLPATPGAPITAGGPQPPTLISGFVVTAVEHDNTALSVFAGALDKVVTELRGHLERLVARMDLLFLGLLRPGSAGDKVREVQQALTDLDYEPGGIDGSYGPRTEAAVKRFQADNGLAQDGIVGAKTWAALQVRRAVHQVRKATELSWFEKLQLFLVAAGDPDEAADEPVMRVFTNKLEYANLLPGLALLGPERLNFRVRKEGSFNYEVRGQIKRGPHVEDTGGGFAPFHPECTPSAGTPIAVKNAVAMVDAGQASRLRIEITLTTGSGSSARTLTAYSTGFRVIAAPAAGAAPVLRPGDRGEPVRRLQQALATAGFDPGGIDGIFGQRTETAVRRFQQAKGLAVDGIVGAQTWAALRQAAASEQGGIGVDVVECRDGSPVSRRWDISVRGGTAGYSLRAAIDGLGEYLFPLTQAADAATGSASGASVRVVAKKPATIA